MTMETKADEVRRVNEACLQNAMREADDQRDRAEKAEAQAAATTPHPDTARLNWLEQNEASIRHHCVSGRQADGSDADAEWWQVEVLDSEGMAEGFAADTIRAAIDYAMNAAPQLPSPAPPSTSGGLKR
jgi:hypothetical protein